MREPVNVMLRVERGDREEKRRERQQVDSVMESPRGR